MKMKEKREIFFFATFQYFSNRKEFRGCDVLSLWHRWVFRSFRNYFSPKWALNESFKVYSENNVSMKIILLMEVMHKYANLYRHESSGIVKHGDVRTSLRAELKIPGLSIDRKIWFERWARRCQKALKALRCKVCIMKQFTQKMSSQIKAERK